MKTFYVTTSLPYVNAQPHLGFALEFVQADVLARWGRRRKFDTFFLTGTDENAFKNVQAAEAAGVNVEEWVNINAARFVELTRAFEGSNDDFIRTSIEERHRLGSEKLWRACARDIYKKRYRGFYCVGCEAFKTEKDAAGCVCPDHPASKLEKVEEENYFFRLSAYKQQLTELIESNKLRIVPEGRRQETLRFIASGLEDISISRSRERAKEWGIKVPGDSLQVIYVWFDALANYITALGYVNNGELYKRYWEHGDEIIHVIGKDINRFHTIYWLAILLSAGIRLPTSVFIHGFITVEGQKMSKSVGNVIDPFELVEQYGVDAVRYYLLREVSSYEDGDFSTAKFIDRYNADLANGLGNFAARVLALVSRGAIRMHADYADIEIKKCINKTKKMVAEKLDEFKFHEALGEIWKLIAFGDRYINEMKPWDKKLSEKHKEQIVGDLLFLLGGVSDLLKPFLPETAKEINERIRNYGLNGDGQKRPKPLFPRLDK